jgi:hypothetical protein
MRLPLVLCIALLSAPAALAQSAQQTQAQAAPEPVSVCTGSAAPGNAVVAPPADADPSKDVPVSGAAGCATPPAISAANGQIAAIVAEAERRLAAMKFEVGPPPRNLTREANPASRPIS